MKNFDSGVRYYTKANLTISFPEDDVCCYRCPLLGLETKSNREYCRRTGELLPAARAMIGYDCPLVFERNEDDV